MHVAFFGTLRSAVIRANLSRNTVMAGTGCGLLLMATACAAPSSSTSSTSVAAAPAPATASQAAYVACLRQHGVAAPTTKPTAKATGQKGADNKIPAAAREACASLRPANGVRNGTAIKAFDACMATQGVTIPTAKPAATPSATPSAKPTGIDRFLHGLSPDSAKVAAALKVCESKLPDKAPATT